MLLFDEADALFGKRTEVRDSHDRYANLEVGYLLQRMESFRGLAILTTNARAALDQAFLRRLRAVVTFPYPDAAAREALWRGAFPAATPRRRLDPGALAAVDLPGGGIAAAALTAAYLGAERGEVTAERRRAPRRAGSSPRHGRSARAADQGAGASRPTRAVAITVTAVRHRPAADRWTPGCRYGDVTSRAGTVVPAPCRAVHTCSSGQPRRAWLRLRLSS